MTDELQKFIEDNIDWIEQATKESWEIIYADLRSKMSFRLIGEFNEVLLLAGIDDPAKSLNYIPNYYLFGSNIDSYNIPDGATSIGVSAFAYCRRLKSVTIPDSVTSINNNAFCKCSSLTSVSIPDNVTMIDHSAFYGCSNLTSVTIGGSITSIGQWTFLDCSSLTSIEIPDGVTSIGGEAFARCISLTDITIPDSVTTIYDRVFFGCTNLKQVKFKGTMKQAIQQGIGNRSRKKWRAESSIERVICSDGVIEL